VAAVEEQGFWSDLVKQVNDKPIAELASSYGVGVDELVDALLRTGTARKAVRNAEAEEAAKPAAPKKKRRGGKKRGGNRKKSVVEAYAHLVGKVPDREVAEKAGVTTGAVRNWRVSRGIPALGRWPEASGDLPPEPGEAQAKPKKAARKAKKVDRRRVSRIDPFADEVGQVPDGVIAKKAGVTPGAVANWRRSRGIPGYRRGAASAEASVAPVATVDTGSLASDAALVARSLASLHGRLAKGPDAAAEAKLLELMKRRDELVVQLGRAALAHVAGGGELAFAG
jgi:transcriptional regulator with XRE-family HTH domain